MIAIKVKLPVINAKIRFSIYSSTTEYTGYYDGEYFINREYAFLLEEVKSWEYMEK